MAAAWALRWDVLGGGGLLLPWRWLVAGLMLGCGQVALYWWQFVWEDQDLATPRALRGLWYLPYYAGGAVLAGLLCEVNRYLGWYSTVILVAAFYGGYDAVRSRLDQFRLDRDAAQARCDQATAEAQLHLKVIEALSNAIESRYELAPRRRRRLPVYCRELARELALPEPERRALLVASLLHDIGKLAVPEEILSKPGRLTREEFAKLKMHPILACEILQGVDFPYPVLPIIRHHHEKWDGSGYPDGLKGEEIPFGARILAAVDCLDALASDRHYRRAFPLDEAMRILIRERGKSFDPRVVLTLERHYRDYECLVRESAADRKKLFKEPDPENEAAPALGFESSWESGWPKPLPAGFTDQLLRLASQAKPLPLVLAELEEELKLVTPFDTLVLYRREGDRLAAEYASGKDAEVFRDLVIPLGQGLSGWVAEKNRPILNGNPAIEPGYLDHPSRFTVLRSAVTVPLAIGEQVVGALSLYAELRDAFHGGHFQLLGILAKDLSYNLQKASAARARQRVSLPDSRAFHAYLAQATQRCLESAEWLYLAVCRVEDLRKVSACGGAAESSRILSELAERFVSQLACSAYPARTEEDELAVVMAPKILEAAAGLPAQLPGEQTPHLASPDSCCPPSLEALSRCLESAQAPENLNIRLGFSALGPGGFEPFELVASAIQSLHKFYPQPALGATSDRWQSKTDASGLGALTEAISACSAPLAHPELHTQEQQTQELAH